MRYIFLGLLLVVGGCATLYRADLVAFDYEAKTGVVSYLNEGMNSVIEARKANAEEIMQGQCKGTYQITKLMNQAQYAGAFTTASTNTYSPTPSANAMSFAAYQNYTYLAFKCQ